jgi:hypothetical protein
VRDWVKTFALLHTFVFTLFTICDRIKSSVLFFASVGAHSTLCKVKIPEEEEEEP